MLWSTDNCQNKVTTDQYHVTILRVHIFLRLTATQILGKLCCSQIESQVQARSGALPLGLAKMCIFFLPNH